MYLDWEKQAQDYYVVDIESNGLTPSVVWVMCWQNVKTGEKGECLDHASMKEFLDRHQDAVFVGHNIVKFDAPVLNRLVGSRLTPSKVIDTLILSTLYSPNISGGHSLGAWGERIGFPKDEFNDWTKLSDEMVSYCHRDVEVTVNLFKKITRVLAKIGFSEKSCEIQHHFTHILKKQTDNGFKFDVEGAVGLLQEIRSREEDIRQQVLKAFPPVEQQLGYFKKAFKKDGTESSQLVRHKKLYDRIEIDPDGGYKVFGKVVFNLGSPAQRVAKLTELGWKPSVGEVTKGGQPKPFERGDLAKSLERFIEDKDVEEVRLLAKWMVLNGRANMINKWLEEVNEKTGCIHGKIFIADTLRLRHQAPNTANVPGVRVKESKDSTGKVVEKRILRGEEGYFTYEARALWVARPDRVLVGTDASGLELRMLAHFLNRDEFTRQVLDGDPHQYNADLAGVDRPKAKTLLYAIQYGAQGPKVAKILDSTVAEGYTMRQTFLDRLGISGIMEQAIAEQKSGRVWLVDGSGVVCPSPHSALNYKLQGSGARVMAQAAIFLERHIRRKGLDSLKVGDIHDEWVYDVKPEDAEEHRRLSLLSLKEAGEELNLNIPIDGNSLIGPSWAHVH